MVARASSDIKPAWKGGRAIIYFSKRCQLEKEGGGIDTAFTHLVQLRHSGKSSVHPRTLTERIEGGLALLDELVRSDTRMRGELIRVVKLF